MPKRVLIVEDHPDIQKALVLMTKRLGHEPITAATVKEALDKLNLSPTDVILDLKLPDGRGITVLHEIRNKSLPVKVAVVTNTNDNDLLAEAKALRPDAIILKPQWDMLVKWMGDE